jgi:hypothetical protein
MMANSGASERGPAIQSVGRAPAPAFDRLAIVYDRQTGEIQHVHRLTSSEKGGKTTDDELRADALRHAELLHGRTNVKADVAFAEVHEWQPGHEHWVNEQGALCGRQRGAR